MRGEFNPENVMIHWCVTIFINFIAAVNIPPDYTDVRWLICSPQERVRIMVINIQQQQPLNIRYLELIVDTGQAS